MKSFNHFRGITPTIKNAVLKSIFIVEELFSIEKYLEMDFAFMQIFKREIAFGKKLYRKMNLNL